MSATAPANLTTPPRAIRRWRVRTRRAAWSILWGVVAFALIQVGTGLLAEQYPRLRDPLFGDKFSRLQRRLTAQPDAFLVVMLGSSRTGLAFHGNKVEAELNGPLNRPVVAFNFGTPASGPLTHLIYLNRILKAGYKPDHLLVEILPSMLTERHGDATFPLEINWFDAHRLTSSERAIALRHGVPAARVQHRWRSSVYLPFYVMRFELLSRVAPGFLPWHLRFDWSRSTDESGWGKMEHQVIPPEQYAKALERARNEYAPILSDLTPGGGATTALKEILAIGEREKIPVTLVLMPEAVPFRAWYAPQTTERLNAFLVSLKTPIVDARNWLADDQFTDGHHMLANGATLFSQRLAREVLLPQHGPKP